MFEKVWKSWKNWNYLLKIFVTVYSICYTRILLFLYRHSVTCRAWICNRSNRPLLWVHALLLLLILFESYLLRQICKEYKWPITLTYSIIKDSNADIEVIFWIVQNPPTNRDARGNLRNPFSEVPDHFSPPHSPVNLASRPHPCPRVPPNSNYFDNFIIFSYK